MSDCIALDFRGLLCPLPVIRLQDAVRSATAGARFEVIATDPGTVHDIPAWLRIHGHHLLHTETRGDVLHFMVEVC